MSGALLSVLAATISPALGLQLIAWMPGHEHITLSGTVPQHSHPFDDDAEAHTHARDDSPDEAVGFAAPSDLLPKYVPLLGLAVLELTSPSVPEPHSSTARAATVFIPTPAPPPRA